MSEDEERHADEVNIAFQIGAEWERKQTKVRIEKLEAALLWYAEHCQKGGDDIEGPYGDYGQRARKALEGKDD